MYGNGKLQVVGTIDAKEMGNDGQVTAGTDGQIFSESLNNAQY